MTEGALSLPTCGSVPSVVKVGFPRTCIVWHWHNVDVA